MWKRIEPNWFKPWKLSDSNDTGKMNFCLKSIAIFLHETEKLDLVDDYITPLPQRKLVITSKGPLDKARVESECSNYGLVTINDISSNTLTKFSLLMSDAKVAKRLCSGIKKQKLFSTKSVSVIQHEVKPPSDYSELEDFLNY